MLVSTWKPGNHTLLSYTETPFAGREGEYGTNFAHGIDIICIEVGNKSINLLYLSKFHDVSLILLHCPCAAASSRARESYGGLWPPSGLWVYPSSVCVYGPTGTLLGTEWPAALLPTTSFIPTVLQCWMWR